MTKLIEKNGAKLSATPALASLVSAAFASGKTLPATIAEVDAKAKARTIHVVSPLYWSEIARALGPIEATDAAIYRARKNGERREVVALRAGVSVARVREVESKGARKPVYVGRGTRRHLAV